MKLSAWDVVRRFQLHHLIMPRVDGPNPVVLRGHPSDAALKEMMKEEEEEDANGDQLVGFR